MNAIAFEADIIGEFLRIPNFELFQNKHVKVVIEEEKVVSTSKLPQAFLKPLPVADYSALGSRDELYVSK